jgi:hypothetical protein
MQILREDNMKYIVRIKETYIKDVIVEASNWYNAENIVQNLYDDGKIDVNVENFDSGYISYLRDIDEMDEECYESVN